ncbi:stage II sporulation protein M [Tenuibacillus multivorans]|uniref:Stage II sporulation protein M n=1 Tax=Tenuibacillus multivorans TaxID=237069 RepID=A0A1H0D0M5_9BACI|nr:stage II sporulation protein M [Tenuibacillus multivorans]GEL76092.1 stage II sporulation protein M [Tenuibacillus multivorans]SDN63658.1 stage II sporulation protein M [Tenuibacillus multivorans]
MKHWLKGSSYTLEPYINLYIFLFVLFVIGVIFGAGMVGSLSFLQKQDLLFFVEQYFHSFTEQSRQLTLGELFSAFWAHGKYVTFLFLFGLSFIGLPVVWFLLFMKGIVIGFTVGFLINQLTWQGFFISLTSVAPQNLLIVPGYLLIVASSMIFCIHVMRMLFTKGKSYYTIGQAMSLYFKSYLIALLIILGGSMIEAFISSQAMYFVLK